MSEQIVISGRGEGKSTLNDVLLDIGALASELESLAGRGYTMSGSVANGVVDLVKPDQFATTDRDKLAAAFMELETVHNYAAPISISWEADCLSHAIASVEEKYPEERPGVAFWYSERDDFAFGYRGYSSLIKEEYDGLPDDIKTEWVRNNVDQIGSAEISERLQHHTLIRPLWIFWAGDPDVIIAILKKHGLNVVDHVHPGECIHVYPAFLNLEGQ